ncbi:MAG TPA: hypothetical protein VMM18_15710 [Gemmatimonadaceae bacterium]|nr:hypothetical protein [Gemmatimonadaceae bacterium]
MVPLSSLWLAIVVSAVIVFVVSSIIHMFLGYHRNDYRRVPNEDDVMDALRPFDLPAGDYVMPHAGSTSAMKSPEYVEKLKAGPIVLMTVAPKGGWGMGRSLVLWFAYSIVVGIFAAYIAGRALGPGADYLAVFRFAGTTAFAAYSVALLQSSIWYRKNWRATLLSVFDGLVYALLTAGTFGWLWPT